MRVLVFHNPSAGHDELSRDDLTGELERAGHEVTWLEKGERQLSGTLAQPFDTVVVAGGDGSVGAVGKELAARRLPIAILPAGTANNLASILGATSDNLIQRLADRRVVSFDLGVIEGSLPRHLFLEGVGRGPFADTVALLDFLAHRQSPAGREDELMRDLHALRESVLTSDACECRIELDGAEEAGNFVMVEITNAGVIGPNLQLSPSAVPFDGLLDVFVVDVSEREKLLKLVADRKANSPPTTPFRARRARRVRFRAPAGQRLHIDGAQLRHAGPVDLQITLDPSALQFYVPRDMKWKSEGELQDR